MQTKYLNQRLNYYYFRFVNTDVRHIGILLPVSILIYSSSRTWHSASACKILSKSANARRSYDAISIFQYRYSDVQMVFTSEVNLLLILRMRRNNNDVHRQLQDQTRISSEIINPIDSKSVDQAVIHTCTSWVVKK